MIKRIFGRGAWLALMVAWSLGGLGAVSCSLCGCAAPVVRRAAPKQTKQAKQAKQAKPRCTNKDDIVLSRSDWLIIRQGQERRKATISKLKAGLEACEKLRRVEVERERKKREAVIKQANSPIPWVVVIVVAALGVGVVVVAVVK